VTTQAFRRIHFVGVGGAGLSALARLALLQGYAVSGSDRTRTEIVGDLEQLGLGFQEGHEPEAVRTTDVVVASSAIAADNAELEWARAHGLVVWKRHEFLPWLTRGKRVVAVSGTHGKTTTTALLAHVLTETGRDPTCLVGGVLRAWASNARLGQSDLFVLEADEYDRTFLSLSPWLGVITSVEMDHPDCYGSLAELTSAFEQFAARCQRLLASADDERASATAARLGGRAQTYGWHGDAAWRLLTWRGDPAGSAFRFRDPQGREDEGWVPLWGRHSVANALAAIAAAVAAGVPVMEALAALGSFAGVERRFTSSGTFAGVDIVDDYAHHPSQIVATVAAARQRFPGRRVVVVFQPHTFSRLAALYADYVAALREADIAFVLPVYGARETGDAGGAATALARDAGAQALPGVDTAAAALVTELRPGDVVLNLGAGDGEELTVALAERLSRYHKESCTLLVV